MKILIVSESFYPDDFAINDTVKILTAEGHEVSVLTGLPDYATSFIPERYKHGRNRFEEYGGAKVYRVGTIARRKGPFFRSLSYLSFAWNGSRFIRHHSLADHDLVYVWQVSPVTMAIPALVWKKLYHKPLYLYCLDIWPECVKAMGFKEGSILFRIIGLLSRNIYRQCDHIAVSSRPFLAYLEETAGIDQERLSYLPQFVKEDVLKGDYRKEADEYTDLLFAGNIGKVQDMECLLKAAALIRNRSDIRFHIIGSGSEADTVQRRAQELDLHNIFFYGRLSSEETLEFYKKADACLLTLEGRDRIGETLPGKLLTYMAAGKPVLAAVNGAGQEVIRESGCGLFVQAGDCRGLAKLFIRFADDKEKQESYGKNGRLYFKKHFTQERHFRQLNEELQNEVDK